MLRVVATNPFYPNRMQQLDKLVELCQLDRQPPHTLFDVIEALVRDIIGPLEHGELDSIDVFQGRVINMNAQYVPWPST